MLQCFEDYSPFIWTIVLSTLTLFDVFYFVRHIWVATEVLLHSRPVYNAAVRLFNKKFASYIVQHDLAEEDNFESRVWPQEVDHLLQLSDQAGALILELARNKALYSTGLIAICWESGTSLWIVSSSQVTWRRRPRMLEKYSVKTLYSPDYEKLHSRFFPIRQVITSEKGEVLCEAAVTLILPPHAQVGDIITKYRERFGEYQRGAKKKRRNLKTLFSEPDMPRSGTEKGDGVVDGESSEVTDSAGGIRRNTSYGSFLEYFGQFSDIFQSALSGMEED